MSNTITIELSKTDRALLENCVAHLGLLVGLIGDLPRNGAPVCHEPEAVVSQAEAPLPEIEQPAEEVNPEPVAEPELPKYTRDDILAKVQSLAQPKNPKRDQVKALVKSYGTKVSDIPEDKYTEVMMQLIALEG